MFKQKTTLHLVEPTLSGLAGHEYGYVASLVAANIDFDFSLNVWLSKSVDNKNVLNRLININKQPITVIKYFVRSVRQLQKIFLYYKFLRAKQPFYVCTAGLLDLLICDFILKYFKFFKIFRFKMGTKNFADSNFGQVAFFHFHQFTKKPNKIKKLNQISKLAKNNFKILTTTNNLMQIFTDSGFINCKTISCPSFVPQSIPDNMQYIFNKVLYAGVARQDKGFSLVVDTIEYLRENANNLPFSVQISAPGSNKFDSKTALAVDKLQQLTNKYYNIKLYRGPLLANQYQELFAGAICLLVYNQAQYNDKFSGVGLDAFYAGCPIITVNNTWMAAIVKKFNAGIILNNPTKQTVAEAITAVVQQYNFYHDNAKQAAKYLIEIHDPKHSLKAVYDYL